MTALSFAFTIIVYAVTVMVATDGGSRPFPQISTSVFFLGWLVLGAVCGGWAVFLARFPRLLTNPRGHKAIQIVLFVLCFGFGLDFLAS